MLISFFYAKCEATISNLYWGLEYRANVQEHWDRKQFILWGLVSTVYLRCGASLVAQWLRMHLPSPYSQTFHINCLTVTVLGFILQFSKMTACVYLAEISVIWPLVIFYSGIRIKLCWQVLSGFLAEENMQSEELFNANAKARVRYHPPPIPVV